MFYSVKDLIRNLQSFVNDPHTDRNDFEVKVRGFGSVESLRYCSERKELYLELFEESVEIEEKSSHDTFRSILTLAGFKVKWYQVLENPYWPRAYIELVRKNPWWLFMTEYGLIKIGWRKRVISIEWILNDDIKVHGKELTEDEVTKDSNFIHAYDTIHAVTYLTKLHEILKEKTLDKPTGVGATFTQ